MIDFTKLRDLIVEKKCVSSNDYGKEDPFIGIYLEDLIDIINQCDSEKWISVDEALPEVSEYYSYDTLSDHVFATDESLENVIVAWYDNGNKKWYQEWTGGEIVQFKITHWMPIPELKGDEE